jgi:nucleotide-binding universal stress UspA family protein
MTAPAKRLRPVFRRILVPVDFTRRNEEALAVASRLAASPDSRISLLHVIERIDHLSPRSLAGFYRKLYRAAEKRMAVLVRSLDTGGAVLTAVIAFGKRAEGIVKCAVDERVDLIVMSSHRVRPGRPRRGWATISHQVAVLAPCDVLLVK